MPNGARRSPDAFWTLRSRLTVGNKRGSFWHLCPDFAIEIKSSSDRLRIVQTKMREYIENGAQLGWLIDPDKRSVRVYRASDDAETRVGITSIKGGGPVAGFVLDLTYVCDPVAD